MASIELQQVSKVFSGYHAVRPLDLEIADGEFFTLLGPSGCGKTTLLRMIAGLEQGTTGRIIIDTVDVTHRPPKGRDIALVFQDYALYPHLSVQENLAFPLRAKKLAAHEIRTKVHDVARRLQLDKLLERRPRQLSGGQQQRVALGRAIVRNPKSFLMDEPLSNLDAKLRIDMRAELKRLQRDLGITTIYVTHDQEEALSMSDRIAVMRDGVIQQCAPPAEIYRHPANRWVASFVGSPSINMLDVQAESEGHETVLTTIGELAGNQRATLRVPRNVATLAAGRYTLGIRPEHLQFQDGPGPGAILGQIDIVELVGDHFIVAVRTDCGVLTVKSYGDAAPAIGQPVYLRFNETRLHMFSAESGMRVSS